MTKMTKLTRRELLRLGGGAAAGSLLATAGLSWQSPAAAQTGKPLVPVRFTPSANLAFSDWFVAEAMGLFRKHGIDGRLILFDVGFLGTEAMIAGHADTATTVEFPLLNYLAKGADIIVPAVLIWGDDMKIVTLKSVAKPEDLIDKRVGIMIGSNAHYAFDRYMTHFKLPRDKIKVISVPVAEQVALFAKGDIDAYVWGEPMVSRGLDVMKDKAHVLSPGPETAMKTRLYLQVLRSWAEKNPDALVGILRALIEAHDFMKTHPERTAQIAAKKLNLPPEQVPGMIRRGGWNWDVHLDASLVNVFREVTTWMRENKRLAAEPPDMMRVLVPDYLKRVAPSRVTGF